MATITEDYVSFEIAKLLKEKGFNCACKVWYSEYTSQFVNKKYTSIEFDNHNKFNENYKFICSAPTLQMAMKWLRKNHQIFIRPNTSFLYPIKWYSEIFCYGDNLKTQQDVKTEYYNSPEEACEAAIKYCLENLI